MKQYNIEDTWSMRGPAGILLTSTILVGVAVYLVRRRRQKPTAASIARNAYTQTRDVASNLGGEVGRELLLKTITPAVKPALQALLAELKALVDDTFARAEKALEEL